jgi:Cd2+/Zn2+-exporting ATPase
MSNATTTTTYQVKGLCCSSEVKLVEDTLGPLPGVEGVQVSLAAGSVRVNHAPDFDPDQVGAALEPVGLSATPRKRPGAGSMPTRPPWWRDADLLPVLVAGLLIVVGVLCMHVFALPTVAVASLVVATAVGGFPVFKTAIRSAKRLDMDINVLMTVAVIGALILGEWLEAAMVVALFAFAEWLEGASMSRARSAIGKLMELAPDEARVVRDGQEEVVPVEMVGIGEQVIVRPGEKIPVDGVVEAGESEVDQAPITGESKPAHKRAGDEVFAGTLNGQGSLDIRVDHAPDDTTLAKVIEAIETAQQNRSESERFVERFARRYTPAVIVLAVLAATVPPLFFGGDWETWFYRSLVLLVIACPCALVLATPITTASALARAARDGILIKGGRFLEELGRIRAVAFDKTGTLTQGRPQVTEVVPVSGDDDALLRLAATAESRSEHYLARAITQAADARGLDYNGGRLVSFQAQVGRGVEAWVVEAKQAEQAKQAKQAKQAEQVEMVAEAAESCCSGGCSSSATLDAPAPSRSGEVGQKILVGSRALLEEHGVDFDAASEANSARWTALEEHGQTVVGVARGDEFLGLIAIEDTPRPEAQATVERLRGGQVDDVYMLTGDNAVCASAVAEELGLDDDAVLANLLPEDKVSAIEKLSKRHRHVAMVGDGINDAPALAAAPVGIAMGAAGTDIALDTAHVALMADDLEKLPQAIDLGARTGRIIRQNIVLALGIKVAVFALAAVGMATLWMAVLADMGTSLLVIFNGMRMLRSE